MCVCVCVCACVCVCVCVCARVFVCMCVLYSMQPNRSLQDNLFDVIAKMFVSIILPMPLEASDKFIEVNCTDSNRRTSQT